MRPHISDLVLELPRTIKHFLHLQKHKHKESIVGNKTPVLVIPGFMTSDWSTKPMRDYLNKQGFVAYGWNQGTNNKFSLSILRQLLTRIESLAKQHNSAVVLVGWSLGGLYARELSRVTPHVSKVITLGSPFGNLFSNYVSDIYQLVTDSDMKQMKIIQQMVKNPLSKPSLNIFSKKDGVVHWMSCFLEADPLSKRKQVSSSHTGMGYDVEVFKHIIDFILKG